MVKPATIEAYIAALPQDLQASASEVRRIIRDVAPDAVEAIKYQIPAFQIAGSTFIYFSVWKKHIGIYPVYEGTQAFEDAIRPWRAKKATVQFAHSQSLPLEIIRHIVTSQLAQHSKARAGN